MYDKLFNATGSPRRSLTKSASAGSRATGLAASRCVSAALTALLMAAVALNASAVRAQGYESESVVRKITGASEKLELTTNSSRILTLGKNVPRVQVNNPELVAVTPLSAKDVQISAKKPGVTQVNLWDEDGNIHTIDVMIYGDARELSAALQTQFPHSSIRVYRYSESIVLTGFVDRPDHVGPIMRLAEDYAPKVINNINVGGVQQILLKVKVMEISRTRLRELGTDWAFLDGSSILAASNVGQLLESSGSIISSGGNLVKLGNTASQTFQFGVFDGDDGFIGILAALQQQRVAKILAEPNLVAVSGRPAQFQVGGEFPILVPQSLGTTTIEFKPFGTIIDFLPIVLGNGNIRLEVRPQVSERDFSNVVNVNGTIIPGLTTRKVDTAVEMKAGQTFALAGLIQERTDSVTRGLPYVSDLPVIGVPFRRTRNDINEIELLILVTPEFVDPIDACEVPCGGPGTYTVSPMNRELYCAGHLEVPPQCNPTQGLGACGGGDECCSGSAAVNGCATCNGGVMATDGVQIITDGDAMPGGVGYDEQGATSEFSAPSAAGSTDAASPMSDPQPTDLPLPEGSQLPSVNPPQGQPPADGTQYIPQGRGPYDRAAVNAVRPNYTASRPYHPPRHPVFLRNASRPHNPQPPTAQPVGENGLIGPVGYDNQ
jgi:pilus assembly protein CpaC